MPDRSATITSYNTRC